MHCEIGLCANLTYLKVFDDELARVFHPLWIVWSTVAKVLHVVMSLEPSILASRILLAVLAQSKLGKRRTLLIDAQMPLPKSIPMWHAVLLEP